MLRWRIIWLFFILTPCLFAQDATDIIRKADERAKGKSSFSTFTIQVIRPNWKREMKMKSWSKGNDLAMLLVTSPVKDKGIVYLKRKKEVWNWIPSIERTIKLPPSMMSQSWMGTDFTNDDLVKEASVVEDYKHTIIGDSVIDDRSSYKILLVPKPESAVVWGKVLMWVDKKDNIIMYAEYFDEDGKLVNSLRTYDIKMLGGRLLPSRMEMTPAAKKNNKTVFIYNELQFDKPIDDNFFTTQNMPRLQ